MAQPNATDSMIFGNAVNAQHYYGQNDLQTVFNDISLLSQDAKNTLWNIPGTLEHMTPEQKSKASAEASFNAFCFIEAAEQMGLWPMTAKQLRELGIERKNMQMPDVPPELRHLEIQQATPELQTAMESKGRRFAVAHPGTEEMRYLEKMEAAGSAGGEDNFHILLKKKSTQNSRIGGISTWNSKNARNLRLDTYRDCGSTSKGLYAKTSKITRFD